ncbi:hypothetical protein HK101_007702 [Irineochytrium annulatum]|nr:hypothetical protein HK101_007702 [Irineochytrium annulatum]
MGEARASPSSDPEPALRRLGLQFVLPFIDPGELVATEVSPALRSPIRSPTSSARRADSPALALTTPQRTPKRAGRSPPDACAAAVSAAAPVRSSLRLQRNGSSGPEERVARIVRRLYEALRGRGMLDVMRRVGGVLSEDGGDAERVAAREEWRRLGRLDVLLVEVDGQAETKDGDGVNTGSNRRTRAVDWAAAGVKGWKMEGQQRLPAHDDMEQCCLLCRGLTTKDQDVIRITRSPTTAHLSCISSTLPDAPRHPITLHTCPVFVLADGHGGRDAAAWFASRIPASIITALRSATAALQSSSAPSATSSLTNLLRHIATRPDVAHAVIETHIQRAISDLDEEFCALRLSQLRASSPSPPDDGATCCGAVLLGGGPTLILFHVGDSRAVVSDHNGRLIHVTADHALTHPGKLASLANAGTAACEVRASRADPLLVLPPTTDDDWDAVAGARVFRPEGFRFDGDGGGVRLKSMGMADARGDLVFKVSPRVFEGRAEVSVVDVGERGGWVVVASDGVWDFLGDGGDGDGVGRLMLELSEERGTVGQRNGMDGGVGSCERLSAMAANVAARWEGSYGALFERCESGVVDDASVLIVRIGAVDETEADGGEEEVKIRSVDNMKADDVEEDEEEIIPDSCPQELDAPCLDDPPRPQRGRRRRREDIVSISPTFHPAQSREDMVSPGWAQEDEDAVVIPDSCPTPGAFASIEATSSGKSTDEVLSTPKRVCGVPAIEKDAALGRILVPETPPSRRRL